MIAPALDWKSGGLLPLMMGGVGVMGALMMGLFAQKDKKMTKLEKACVAVVIALGEKLEELEKRNSQLTKELGESVSEKSYKELQRARRGAGASARRGGRARRQRRGEVGQHTGYRTQETQVLKTIQGDILMKKLIPVLFALAISALAGQASAADLVPQFGYVAPTWVAVPGPTGPGPVDLSAVWHAFGFQESGLGYAYVAGSTGSSPYWERFDPLGTTYEAFFGAYVIDNFKYASDWENADGSQKTNMRVSDVVNSANELIGLGVADQFAWLSFYSAPYSGPTASTYVPNSLVIVPAPNGFFSLTFLVQTTSDLGAPTQPAPFVPPYSTYAADVPAFQPILVEAEVLVKYDVAHANFVAIYGSGANYQVDGHDKNTPVSTILKIAQMMGATTFQ